MSSARGEQRGKRRMSRDNSPCRSSAQSEKIKPALVSPEHNLQVPNYMRPTISSSLGQSRHSIPNYMRPTISSSLGQNRRCSISSSSSSHPTSPTKETLIRSSSKKWPSSSSCPRIQRSSSFIHEPSPRLLPSSPRISKNQLFEPSKQHSSKGSNRSSLNDSGKRFPALSRTSSCIASPCGNDTNQTKITAMQEMNIEDHQGDRQLESSTLSHIIEGHCDPAPEDNERVMVVDQVNHNDYDPVLKDNHRVMVVDQVNHNDYDPVLEDNDRVLVVDQVNHYDYDPHKIFDEVQAMMLEDHNCDNEIHPEILEDNKEHIAVLQKDNHDQPCTDVDVDAKGTNEIHIPNDDIGNSYHRHVDAETSNEIHIPGIEENKVSMEDVKLTVIDEVKVLIEDVQLDNHTRSDDEKDQGEDCRVQIIEDVHHKEDAVIVQADDYDQPCNYQDQDGIHENSREILPTTTKEDDQPYHCEKQVEFHGVGVEDEKDAIVEVEVEDEKDAIVEVEDEKDAIVEVEDEKDVMIAHEDDHDQPPNYLKQEDVDLGDHFESCSTNQDINEENKASNSDEFNAKPQNQEQDPPNATEAQENERNQGEGMTSTDVPKEAIKIEVLKESTSMHEQGKEPIIVTQASQEQNERNQGEDMTSTDVTKEAIEIEVEKQSTSVHKQGEEPIIVTEASEEQNETKKVSINKRFIINKKEPTVAYNDVIEETKSKLLQDRKNKVKALVGAFETVMSIDQR